MHAESTSGATCKLHVGSLRSCGRILWSVLGNVTVVQIFPAELQNGVGSQAELTRDKKKKSGATTLQHGKDFESLEVPN